MHTKANNKFMLEALDMANIAFQNNEVPVGAIIVKDEKVIGRGFNQVIATNSVVAHAEINAIKSASKELNNYRLTGCDIYVTLEPCHMCAKAIVDARIKNLYFGALEPKTGAIISVDTFFDARHLNHRVSYDYGLLKDNSANLLKSFFRLKRAYKKDSFN